MYMYMLSYCILAHFYGRAAAELSFSDLVLRTFTRTMKTVISYNNLELYLYLSGSLCVSGSLLWGRFLLSTVRCGDRVCVGLERKAVEDILCVGVTLSVSRTLCVLYFIRSFMCA